MEKSEELIYLDLIVGEVPLVAMVDSGAQISLCTQDAYVKLMDESSSSSYLEEEVVFEGVGSKGSTRHYMEFHAKAGKSDIPIGAYVLRDNMEGGTCEICI